MLMDMESVLPLAIPALVVVVWYLRTRRRFSAGRLVAVICFAVYLLQVSKYTIFPLRLDSASIAALRHQSRLLDGVNVVPFRGWSLAYLASVQVWGNLLLGVPWGLLLPFVAPVAGWRAMVRYGATFATAIELLQLAISLLYGFAYRVIDINDVLLNFAGAMLGYALVRLSAWFYRAASGRSLVEARPREDHPAST